MCAKSDTSSVTSGDTALITALASVPDRIARMMAEVDEDTARRHPSPGEWCVVECVIHLSDVEPRDRARLERIASEDNPQVPAIWPRPMPDPLPLLREALADYRDERANTVEFLSTLAPSAWERPAVHATLGTTTLRRQVQGLLDHDEDHLYQITQTVKLVGGH